MGEGGNSQTPVDVDVGEATWGNHVALLRKDEPFCWRLPLKKPYKGTLHQKKPHSIDVHSGKGWKTIQMVIERGGKKVV